MNKYSITLLLSLFFTMNEAQAGGPVCTPNVTTAFSDNQNQAFTLGYGAVGSPSLYRQCTDMSNQQFINSLNQCGSLAHPIDGLGLSPSDNFLYGLMPTDNLGIGAHIQFDIFPFPSPGDPGDMMKADVVDVYRIGNDGGYQRIGQVDSAPEDAGLPAGTHQVVPTVHTAASFNQAGDLYLLGYKSNYTSSADVIAGTGEVLYQTPEIMIGQISAANLTAASGGVISASWSQADTTVDPVCAAVMNQFRDRTNAFSTCVVAEYIADAMGGAVAADDALESCVASTGVLDYGIHDFAVSPVNGNYYAFDSTSYDTTDVLIEVDANTMVASCTDFPDAGQNTGVLTSLMFSEQNKLVAVFADESMGRWINVANGTITDLTDLIDPFPFGDGSSIPFTLPRGGSAGSGDLIFKDGFEVEFIFANGFEGDAPPPVCPSF